MAGVANGWHLRWRGPVAHVRFSAHGTRYSVSTGERDPSRARAAAARIYTETLARGARRVVPRVPSLARTELATAEWIADLEATHDRRTAHEYDLVAAKWSSRWPTLGEMTPASIADYARERLREVSRETVRKHLVMIRSFFAWAKERGLLDAVPEVPRLPARSAGTRTRAPAARVPLTEAEARKLLAALPEWTTDSPRHPRGRLRDWAIVAWETGLRPATLARLRTPDHYTKGAKVLRITADVDKARYDRELPLSARARKALDRSATKPGVIFGSHDYREALERAGLRTLGRVVRPYDLRHSRITLWVGRGANLLGVQYLAGHKDLSTTAKYAHASRAAAKKIVGR